MSGSGLRPPLLVMLNFILYKPVIPPDPMIPSRLFFHRLLFSYYTFSNKFPPVFFILMHNNSNIVHLN